MISLQSIFFTSLLVLGLWYWIRARDIKDHAYHSARRYCEKMDLQLLDQTVALKAVKPARSASGLIQLRRRYVFDFSSTGEDRYEGEIRLLGAKVEEIKLAPHRLN